MCSELSLLKLPRTKVKDNGRPCCRLPHLVVLGTIWASTKLVSSKLSPLLEQDGTERNCLGSAMLKVTGLRSCVKVDVAVLGPPSLTVLMVISVDVKQH